jgi:hypothetical protein
MLNQFCRTVATMLNLVLHSEIVGSLLTSLLILLLIPTNYLSIEFEDLIIK